MQEIKKKSDLLSCLISSEEFSSDHLARRLSYFKYDKLQLTLEFKTLLQPF